LLRQPGRQIPDCCAELRLASIQAGRFPGQRTPPLLVKSLSLPGAVGSQLDAALLGRQPRLRRGDLLAAAAQRVQCGTFGGLAAAHLGDRRLVLAHHGRRGADLLGQLTQGPRP
jgi:hypothetical protein